MTKKQPISEELVAIDDELLAAIAKVKGHAVQKAVPRPLSEIYPVSAVAEATRLKALEEMLKNPKAGQEMPDGTIYLGKYSPTDRNGNSLGLEFNTFAAKEDLDGRRAYHDTVKHMSRLKNWNGYDGAGYADDAEFYDALKKGKYDGKWIIPTKDVLIGEDHMGEKTMQDNLYAHKDAGVIGDTFYWSCTRIRESFYALNSHRNVSATAGEYGLCYSCRPVRLVPCK